MCLDHGVTTLTSPVCGKARRCCCERACVRGEEAKKPLPRRPGARGGAGRGALASNGPQVRRRAGLAGGLTTPLPAYTTLSVTTPGGVHPPADLITRVYRGTISNRRQNPHKLYDSFGKKIMEQEESFPCVSHESLSQSHAQCPHMVQ